jgi:hypothetical protein
MSRECVRANVQASGEVGREWRPGVRVGGADEGVERMVISCQYAIEPCHGR